MAKKKKKLLVHIHPKALRIHEVQRYIANIGSHNYKALCGVPLRHNIWWCGILRYNRLEPKKYMLCKRCAKSRKIPMLLLKELNNE